MCQTMAPGLYTRWDFDSETSRFTPRQNKTPSFENMVMSFFQRTGPECEIESFFTTGQTEKKLIASVLMGFVLIATLYSKPLVASTTSVLVKSCVPLSLKKIFNVVARRESSMHWDDTIYKRKATKVIEMWECEWWRLFKTVNSV